jgi:hypothetical protein
LIWIKQLHLQQSRFIHIQKQISPFTWVHNMACYTFGGVETHPGLAMFDSPDPSTTMNLEKLVPLRPLLLVLSILGFLLINCPFLYFTLMVEGAYAEAMGNGIALVFMGEAFLLLGFFAFLIAKLGGRSPGWLFFVGMSLLGGLAFSIPLQLWLWSRPTVSPLPTAS